MSVQYAMNSVRIRLRINEDTAIQLYRAIVQREQRAIGLERRRRLVPVLRLRANLGELHRGNTVGPVEIPQFDCLIVICIGLLCHGYILVDLSHHSSAATRGNQSEEDYRVV